MGPEEIIRFTVGREKAESVMRTALNYALFSIPFTINRMGIGKIESRIINIAKGKLAEELFKCFIKENNIPGFDFESTQTPYYQVDKGDFIFKGYEWDIKNNYVFCTNFSNKDIMTFLALVPNRHANDQWEKRSNTNFPTKAPKGKAFLFTFMKSIALNIMIPPQVLSTIEYYTKIYEGKPQSMRPEKFEKELRELLYKHEVRCRYNYNNLELIISAYATKIEFDKFRNIPQNFSFSTSQKDTCFTTKIQNKGVEIKELPSFKSFINGS